LIAFLQPLARIPARFSESLLPRTFHQWRTLLSRWAGDDNVKEDLIILENLYPQVRLESKQSSELGKKRKHLLRQGKLNLTKRGWPDDFGIAFIQFIF
jgi:hypothetical protein